MKILLLQQDLGHGHRTKPIYPIGLACLAARLAPEHEVRIIDPNLFSAASFPAMLRRELKAFGPDVIGLSVKYIDTTNRMDPYVYYAHVPPLVSLIKHERPRAAVVAGGAGFSIFARDIMEDVPLIDFGVFLEGEESFAELLEHLESPEEVRGIFYRKNGSVRYSGDRKRPPFRNGEFKRSAALLDPSPYITDDHRIFGVQTKRGCAFDCSYCTYPFLNGRDIRLRDPGDVVDEVEFFAKNFGLSEFSFADDIFNVPRQHAEAICRELIRRKLDLAWSAWCDLASLSGDFLALASRAGCRHLDFSPDASTPEGLRALGKKLSVGDIARGIRLAQREKNINFAFNFFCSHPQMRLGEAWKTLWYWLTIPVLLWKRGRVSLNWIRIYPHTAMFRVALQEGVLTARTPLLAKTPLGLKSLFYKKRSFFLMDMVFSTILKAAEHCLKPLLKIFFKIRGGTYPFYYG